MGAAPALWWLRRDLRLADNPALTAALAEGGPVLPVFIWDSEVQSWGAAARLRLALSLKALAADLAARGGRLLFLHGEAAAVLLALAAATGAQAVHWGRLYSGATKARDAGVKAALKAAGLRAESHAGALLAEPWDVQTAAGTPFQIFTPFWRALVARGVAAPAGAPPPPRWPAPPVWPESAPFDAASLAPDMRRGGPVVAAAHKAGEAAAAAQLAHFLRSGLETYASDRDRIDRPGTSGLSAALSLGEISPQQIWQAAQEAARADSRLTEGAEAFCRQLAWRDFAWHLFHHDPEMGVLNWRRDWAAFPWQEDAEALTRWQRGQTGVALVDAAMRALYATGLMPNRARMIVASYLCKHLLLPWQAGLSWFADCLCDWDAASNALGWQWVAGSGPDAAPYFRVFNPESQAAKFDPEGAFTAHYLTPGAPGSNAFHAAAPLSWRLDPAAPRPAPLISLAEGRARALAAYARFRA